MARFKHYDDNQMSMVVINYLEQIQPGTFEFALHYLISEKLDLSAFHHPYKNDTDSVVLRNQHHLQSPVVRYRAAFQ